MISVISQRFMKYSMRAILHLEQKTIGSQPSEYYLAYGANLSLDRLKKNQIRYEEIGPARVDGWAIEFTMPCEYKAKGFASLRQESQNSVWGMLFKINRVSLLMFDILEWTFFGSYKRIQVDVIVGDQVIRNAWIYVAKNPSGGLKPSKGYLDMILKEATRLNFPESYIAPLKNVESESEFELDPGFSLLFQSRRRLFEKELSRLYLVHDRIREALAARLP